MQHLYMDLMVAKRESFRMMHERQSKDRRLRRMSTSASSSSLSASLSTNMKKNLGYLMGTTFEGVFEEEFVAAVAHVLRYTRYH